jgi:hypothetical protein
MIIAGNIISGFGLMLSVIGSGYWVWYGCAFEKNRFAAVRNVSPWGLLGNLTVIGMLVFVAGRLVASSR